MKRKFMKPINTKNIKETAVKEEVEEEPLSPAARLFQSRPLNCCIITVLGSNTRIDVNAVKLGLDDSLVKHPRFSSLLVTDEKSNGKMSWRRTKVDVNKHVFDNPDLDPNMELADKYVEDYISNLTTTTLDLAKPLWELHILNVKTSDANAVAVLKVHHSIGDGISLMSLLLASSRKASDPQSLPSFPNSKRITSSDKRFNVFLSVLVAIWTMILMIWNTFVDVLSFGTTALFLKDTGTPIKDTSGVGGLSPKRIVHKVFSFDDIKLVKSAMSTTINDVLLGVTMAGISRYLNRKYATTAEGETDKNIDLASKKIDYLPPDIRLRATLLFNLRPSTGIQSMADMMEKDSKVKWGNVMGYVLLPIAITLPDDPLDYIRKAKATVDRKKLSFEAICSYSVGWFVLKLLGLKKTAAVMHKIISNTTMSFSNVVGPQEEISFYGHHLSYIAPSVYGQPQALTVHWQSYGGKMILVLTVDPEVIPDYNNLCTDFEASIKLIKDCCSTKRINIFSVETGH